MPNKIAVVLKGYPRLSETFIAQELLELERAGLDLTLISLRHPTDKSRHPIHSEIKADISYLPEYLHDEPLRVLKAWWSCRKLPGYRAALRTFIGDLKRDRTRNRIRRFGQALVMANELPDKIQWIYAHFIHTPASVAYYTHLMNGLPWSISAHAKDIWTSPDWELAEKLDDASWTVTCTKAGFEHLLANSRRKDAVHLVHHGIDLSRFTHVAANPSERDGSDENDPVRLVTVGRAVEKKGLDTLIDALAKLPADLHWRWTHIGGGVLSDQLAAQIERLGLANRAQMLGAKPQQFVLQTYQESDFFVLPCRVAKDGDRDGLPNVLMEAQSQGLACISSPISGVVELIKDKENGLLTPPDDVDALAQAMETLARDPAKRNAMGLAGAEMIKTKFDHLNEIKHILRLFEQDGAASSYQEAAQ